MTYAIMYVQVTQYCILSLPMERVGSYLELPRKKKKKKNKYNTKDGKEKTDFMKGSLARI